MSLLLGVGVGGVFAGQYYYFCFCLEWDKIEWDKIEWDKIEWEGIGEMESLHWLMFCE